MKKGNSFTLIELLAVILVISIPRILDVLEESKVNTFKSTVKLIADRQKRNMLQTS